VNSINGFLCAVPFGSNSFSFSSIFFPFLPSARGPASLSAWRRWDRRYLSLSRASLGARKLLWPRLPDGENDVGEEQDRLILPHQLAVLPAAVSVAPRGAGTYPPQPLAFTVRGTRVQAPILLAEALHVDQRRGQVRLIPPLPHETCDQ
jgi:hypothetical protein